MKLQQLMYWIRHVYLQRMKIKKFLVTSFYIQMIRGNNQNYLLIIYLFDLLEMKNLRRNVTNNSPL